MRTLSLLACLVAVPVSAQDRPSPLICAGSDSQWDLQIDTDAAEFTYLRDSSLDVVWETRPDGDEWPLALTLIGRGDSAIAILTPDACLRSDVDATNTVYGITVLTQRGETPVMLVGCCFHQED